MNLLNLILELYAKFNRFQLQIEIKQQPKNKTNFLIDDLNI